MSEQLFNTDPGLRWLFCMTHPDDEIAIAAWIKRLTSAGADVHMSWTHSIPVREEEARAVAESLGTPQGNLIFHCATDGHVCDEVRELLPKFRKVIADIAPDRVVCGAFEQGHLDHDATNFLVNHSFNGPVIEVPLYHTYLTKLQRLNRFADPVGEDVIELTQEERDLKLQIAKSYPSQNIWSVLVWYEIYCGLTLGPGKLRRTERMRWQTKQSYLRPNLPAKLANKVARSEPWRQWLAAVGPVALELAEDRATLVAHGRAMLS